MAKIVRVWAREILDSRGKPTVEAVVQSDSGQVAVSSAPSGASTGKHEALEIRDNDENRFKGFGVTTAVNNVNNVLGPAIVGMEVTDQFGIDKKLSDTDGNQNKSKYGANAIIAVSCAAAKVGAMASGKSLFLWINSL